MKTGFVQIKKEIIENLFATPAPDGFQARFA
jgi:hypothetical protein